MNKFIFKLILFIFLAFSLSCEKDDETFDPISITGQVTDASGYNKSDGAIDLTVTGGVEPYAFVWSNSETTEDISSLSAGKYVVTVTDNKNNTETDTFVVNQPEAIIIQALITDVTIYGASNGVIQIAVSGGVDPYSYQWSNNATEKDIDNLTAGKYILKVTDKNNVSQIDTFIVTQPDEIIIEAEVSEISSYNATDGRIVLEITGGIPPYIFEWSNNETNKDISNLAPGDYIIKVTDQNNAIKTDTFTLSRPEPDEITITGITKNVSAYGLSDGAIELEVTGGVPPYSFLWSDNQADQNIYNLSAGEYVVTITDQLNTIKTDTFEISQPVPPPIVINETITHVSTYNGNDGAVSVEATGGVTPYTYEWNIGETQKMIDNLQAGTYILTITDQINTQKKDTFVVLQPEPNNFFITKNITNVSAYGLNDGAIDISILGGVSPFTFTWSDNRQTEDIDNLSVGRYILTVTDAQNITKTDTTHISQPDPEPLLLEISKQNASDYAASDGTASALVSGGVEPYTYQWSNGFSSKDIEGLKAGVYVLTVTDALNAVISKEIEIKQPDPIEIVIIIETLSPTVTGGDDGSINVSLSGGYPPYGYLWSNGSQSKDIEGITAGDYTINITDSRGQNVSKTIHLTDSLYDIDGNQYSIVQIGSQLWMGENLRVEHAPDGTPITGYAYNNNHSKVEKYGLLYSWDVAMNGATLAKSQGICPDGWHVPSDNEFKELEIYLGMTQEEADLTNTWRGENVGTKLKKGGSSGYNAQLSGRRTSSGKYSLLGIFEYMWTSNSYGSDAWRRCLDINSDEIGRWNTFPKSYGFSVRCIKDNE